MTSIMPVFNGAAYIGAAIESLCQQTRPPVQIVVVDDGSTDDSAARALAAGKELVTLIRQPNRGYHAARNAGLAAAQGDVIHYFDADDIAPPHALEAMIGALSANPGWDAVFGCWRNFWIDALAAERDADANRHLVGVQRGLVLMAALFRRTLLDRMPPFPESGGWAEGPLWTAELVRSGANLGRIGDVVLERRIHHDNDSRKKTLDGLIDLAFKLRKASRASTTKTDGAANS
ncbi:hypothetical protein NX02_00185 [Sphingomonas sanxanigenens DSM 19645 = NX02]|uniref:Glycosyltransferase 2-like domain-containing protein n=2 Tax=Sphingomonas sanxanigenens TaxID=397260 RepID=W0A443_9SPHN|nr:hypothetical protein NX02_00185 [Sphingomonas sanxanigenens DSM 19645 = NX02]